MVHSFLGKVCRKKKGAWSSSESNSHGTAWEITCDFIFTDKRPLLCGGYSDPDDRRCIQYDAPRDKWYFNTSSLMGRWVNMMYYLFLWQILGIGTKSLKITFWVTNHVTLGHDPIFLLSAHLSWGHFCGEHFKFPFQLPSMLGLQPWCRACCGWRL